VTLVKKLGILVLALGSATAAMAQSHADYRTATVIAMTSAPCGATAVCDEYVVESADTTYHIRATHEKHADLLAVGDTERFRLDQRSFVIADAASPRKERAFTVVSMEPRTYAAVRLHGVG
jgi:hypothetical protein